MGSLSLATVVDAITWFAVLGAGAAAFKHGLTPDSALAELSPVAKRDGKWSPEGLWWGGYAFSAMNVGFFVNGVHALVTGDATAKRGVLLTTSSLFAAFALAWATHGELTGKSPQAVRMQTAKVAGFATLFLLGYVGALQL